MPSPNQSPALRRAHAEDVDRLIAIRNSVAENRLRDPRSVTRSDYEFFVTNGWVWVSLQGGFIQGFAAGDPRDGTVWALFVDAAHKGAGVGAMLLTQVCADLQTAGHAMASLTTEPGTRADRLYRRLGWTDNGMTDAGEVRFTREF